MTIRPTALIPAVPLAAFAALAFATPAAAQDDAGDSINQLIIYGDDACPPSSGDEIVVCARKPEGDRYRIPRILRQSGDPANESWAERAQSFEMVGDFGVLSCDPSGLGGSFGCTTELIEKAYAERENSSDVRFSQLIAEERAKRLSTIDAEAAAEQERVEQIERESEERLQREREQALPGEGDAEGEALPDVGMIQPGRPVPVEGGIQSVE